MTDVEPKVVTIQLAMDVMAMQSSHVGNKTYYANDHTGTIRPITTRALYVSELKQDLLGGTSLTKAKMANCRVVLDSDEDLAGAGWLNWSLNQFLFC